MGSASQKADMVALFPAPCRLLLRSEDFVYVPPACAAGEAGDRGEAALLRCYTPVFVVEKGARSYDRIGTPEIRLSRAREKHLGEGRLDVGVAVQERICAGRAGTISRLRASRALAVRNSNGSVEAAAIAGDAELETSFGAIQFSDMRKRVTCTGSNSRVTGVKVADAVTVRNTFGTVEVRDAAGVEIQNSNGKITVPGVGVDDVDVSADVGGVKHRPKDLLRADPGVLARGGGLQRQRPDFLREDRDRYPHELIRLFERRVTLGKDRRWPLRADPNQQQRQHRAASGGRETVATGFGTRSSRPRSCRAL